MKSKSKIIISACLAAALCFAPSAAFAKAKASPSPASSPTEKAEQKEAKAPRAIPFRGTATAVDQSGKTFTIAGKENSRVFKVTEKSAVTKMGTASTLSELKDNDTVTGSYWKHEDGTLEVKSLKIGGKMDSDKKTKKSKKDAEAAPSPSASPKK